MVCEHLASLEYALLNANIVVKFRGQAWSKQCREWVYFDCVLDTSKIRSEFNLGTCIVDHEHKGTHDGQELGFTCAHCRDGIMGLHPDYNPNAQVFP